MSDRARVFYGRMENGRPVMEKPADFESAKEALEGKRFSIRLREAPEVQDLEKMRAFLHGVVIPEIAKSVGYSLTKSEVNRVKDGLKEIFLTDPATGEVVSTESLSPAQYAAFIDECIQYAAEEYGVVIPDSR